MTGVLPVREVDLVCTLATPQMRDATVAGAKAASLAVAAGHGLPVVPGFVLTTPVHAAYLAGGRRLPPELTGPLREAWAALTDDGAHPVVVRSSSTVEDVAASSMAGRFTSVLDVRGWERLLAAVQQVLASAEGVGAEASPMAVLVQRQVSPSRSGVMFGVDPVTGDRAHVVVEAVAGGPDKLVSGQVTAEHYVLTRRGRLRSVDGRPPGRLRPGRAHRSRLLLAHDLHALADLARTTRGVYGGDQDVEWAVDPDGTLLLLQSRPVTATASTAPAHGPVLGPGPLAETFPDPLSELEVDLWIAPLREAVLDAMRETRAVPPRQLEMSPVVATVHGRVAADLELFGYVPTHRTFGVLDPRPAARQLRSAWHTGVLRAELPARSEALVGAVDAALSGVDPSGYDERELLSVLQQGVLMLRDLHRAEMLAGTLLPAAGGTAAAMALQVLAAADPRTPTERLVRRHPVLLSLTPPSLGAAAVLPPGPAEASRGIWTGSSAAACAPLGPREQLRLRVRWVQEMTARVARELGDRLAGSGRLEDAADIGLLRLTELRDIVTGGLSLASVVPLEERRTQDLAAAFSAPLPAEFRLAADGSVVPVRRRGTGTRSGVPAGGGRGVGPVCHGSVRRPPAPGDVLVVRELSPALAAWLPGLAGLVGETGGALSHLAILAREYGVPTVVAVPDALERFAPGTRLLVDGSTGEVRPVRAGGLTEEPAGAPREEEP